MMCNGFDVDQSLAKEIDFTRSDTLIIGAGPSGLFAAAELARHGVEARLVERDVRPHGEARATTIQPGTLEILNSVGPLPPFLDASEHIRCSRMYGPDMSELAATSHDGIHCNCEPSLLYREHREA